MQTLLELLGFCAFLLVADRNDKKSLFNSFQYLIGGGLAMLIFLIGVVQAFTFTGSFLLEDLVRAPNTALCLIIAGLLTKSGVFLCGQCRGLSSRCTRLCHFRDAPVLTLRRPLRRFRSTPFSDVPGVVLCALLLAPLKDHYL